MVGSSAQSLSFFLIETVNEKNTVCTQRLAQMLGCCAGNVMGKNVIIKYYNKDICFTVFNICLI